jgi:hypothetical protein
LILRGFANAQGRVLTYDRESGAIYPQGIDRAAAQNDYNTLTLEDSTRTDTAEKVIADLVEGPAASLVHRLMRGGRLDGEVERHALARLVAFQFLRVPGNREQIDAMQDSFMKLDMAAGGPMKMRDVLAAEFGRAPTEDEVREHWAAVRDFDFTSTLPAEYHVQESMRMLDEFTPVLARAYTWNVIRWKRRSLLTSDMPVMLIPPPGFESEPVGLYTAGSIYFAIGRRASLFLLNRAHEDSIDGQDLPGTFSLARRLNAIAAGSSRRWVYFHTSDSLDDLLGSGWHLAPSPTLEFDDDHSVELRSRLRAMGEWAFEHPNEPHPFIGPSSFQPPWDAT